MPNLDRTKEIAIMQVLHESGSTVSSAEIASNLQARSYDISPRTVRYYLRSMQEKSLVEEAARGRKGGSRILPRGVQELHAARTVDRVGFMQAALDQWAYRMDFDPDTGRGQIVLNITLIKTSDFSSALPVIREVYATGLGMGNYLAIFPPGSSCGTSRIPSDHVGLGTICSVTLNGILLSAGIPTISRFGGNLEIEQRTPVRFTELIAYEGTTLDPLEIFIKAGLTRVQDATRHDTGYVGASFREVPTAATPRVQQLQDQLEKIGLAGMLFMGPANQSFLHIPITENRTGMVVIGGLNPAAAVEEAGIPTSNRALSTLYDFDRLIHFHDAEHACRRMELLSG